MGLGQRDRVARLGGGADQRQRLGDAAPAPGRLAEAVHDGVHGVLGHLAVGGELAAGDGDDAVGRGHHGVAAREVGRALRDMAALGRRLPAGAAGRPRPR